MRNALIALTVLTLAGPVRAQDMPLSQILPPGEGWQALPKIEFTPRERELGKYHTRYWAYHPGLKTTFFTQPKEQAVFALPDGATDARKIPIAAKEPTDLLLWPGNGTLVVADAAGKHLWAYRVTTEGNLDAGDRYYPLRVRPGENRSEATFLTQDSDKRVYAASKEGIHVYDPTGRLCGVLMLPGAGGPVGFLRLEGDQLLTAVAGKVYGRRLLSKAVPKP